jgi:hypothetical protein
MDEELHAVLVRLGPGGTRELAEAALAMIRERDAVCLESVQTVLGNLELGGLSEVCTVLGKKRQAAGHWISGRHGPGGFPEPLWNLAATPVWNLAEVRAWAVNVGVVEPSEEG